jgi:hypothetical protein
MALFDRTAKRLVRGPTVVLTNDPTDLLKSYAPDAYVRGDRLVVGNGVLLYGPVDVTAEVAAKTGLETGNGYYTRAGVLAKTEERPEPAKALDGEWLVRGLAARLHGVRYSHRSWSDVTLDLSVYAEEPVPAEQVIAVLQPFAGFEPGRELFVEEHETVHDSYFLLSEQEPVFITAFWPGRLARSKVAPPPLALGDLRGRAPCRWQLLTKQNAATADPAACRLAGEAALALAESVGGVVTDTFGFLITRAEEVLPG